MEINLLIFIGSTIMTGVISFHLMFRFMILIGEVEDNHDFSYPVYACIMALGVMSYIVHQTSLLAFPFVPHGMLYGWSAVGSTLVITFGILTTILLWKNPERYS